MMPPMMPFKGQGMGMPKMPFANMPHMGGNGMMPFGHMPSATGAPGANPMFPNLGKPPGMPPRCP